MDLLAAGLGLDHGVLRFERTTDAWIAAGAALRDEVADELRDVTPYVEVIGSSSVLGLLAKPIADLAAGLLPGTSPEPAIERMVARGWRYRGDAGDDGGHVLVLETEPWLRVAHLHLVAHDCRQWRDYLALRDLLRGDPDARERYEAVKRRLLEEGTDRKDYTRGKTDVVTSLLSAVR